MIEPTRRRTHRRARLALLALPLVLIVASTVSCTPLTKAVPYDFDGDGRADRVVVNGDTGEWKGIEAVHPLSYMGQPGDLPVPGDYDGDGRNEIVVVRGDDWVRSDGTVVGHLAKPRVDTFGVISPTSQPHALPVPGDYDGDGKTEPAWYQEDTATWTFADGSTTVFGHGPTDPHGCCFVNNDADIPVPADYDGDGRTDLAVFDPVTGRWLIRNSSDGTTRTITLLANPQDDYEALPVPADYDGVGHAQPAELALSGFIVEGHTDKVPVTSSIAVFEDELPASADFDGIGHATPSTFNTPTNTWTVQGRWRISGVEPAVVPRAGTSLWFPVTYPIWLVATSTRTILVDKNYVACNQGSMYGFNCDVPS